MPLLQRIFLTALGLALVVVAVYYLSSVFVYILISAVLALIGRPLMNVFCSIKIGRFRIPSAIGAVLTLGIFVLAIMGFIGLFLPLVLEQARISSAFSIEEVKHVLEEPLHQLHSFLEQYQLGEIQKEVGDNPNVDYLIQRITKVVNLTNVGEVFGGLIGALGNIFIATFSILFITFFFLKDRKLLTEFIFAITPNKHMPKIKAIMRNTRSTLSRYFLGIVLQVVSITTLVTIGLSIVGVQNALVIGFFAGIINVIPYIGPLIGAAFGITIGLSSEIQLALEQGTAIDFYGTLLPLAGWIAVVFLIVQLLDNFIFQPLIFSSSVDIHPLEVFLVILIAGTLAGVPGMILAVPTYAFLRIIASEFLSEFKLIQYMNREDEDD